jgi:hypothetical protein
MATETERANDRAKAQAHAQLEGIKELVTDLLNNDAADEYGQPASERIQEDALSVETRSDWGTPSREMEAVEYQILLCWGGPAVRIVGEIGDYGPDSAEIEYQDWMTPWTKLDIYGDDAAAVLNYAGQFYFN